MFKLSLHLPNIWFSQQAHFTCSSSSNEYARQLQQRFKQTIINAKFGGHLEATRRVLAQLPISAQSYSSSPYLDLALYSYDEKWVSVMERPKSYGDHPIRYPKKTSITVSPLYIFFLNSELLSVMIVVKPAGLNVSF